MKIIQRTYRYELNPTSEQAILLAKHFGSTRWVYNYFLNQKQEQYKENKKSDSYNKQSKTLTNLKKQEAYEWLKEVNSQSLQHALRCLDTAYQNFFSKKAGYPKFKSKKGKQSFHVPQFIKVVGNHLIIPKFREAIKIILHRELKGEIRNCTITKTKTGKYFVSIVCNEEYNPLPKTGKSIGIDLGLTHFVITSDGRKFENHKYTKKYEKKLATAQKHLSRKVKGSNSFESQKRKVAKIHEKIKNSRQDNLDKVSYQLVKDFDILSLENLNVRGMIQNPKLSKHIADASWGNFVRMVEYKADWNDKQVIKIDRFYPSSKTCSCGHINHNLTLYDRTWTCGVCHTTHDRDVLAAANILKEGLKIKSLGTSDNTGGVMVRLKTRRKQSFCETNKHVAKKPEAHPSRAGE